MHEKVTGKLGSEVKVLNFQSICHELEEAIERSSLKMVKVDKVSLESRQNSLKIPIKDEGVHIF